MGRLITSRLLPPTAAPQRRRFLGQGATALAAAGGALLGTSCSSLGPVVQARPDVVPFSGSDRLGGLPEGWQLHVTRPDRPVTAYGLQQIDGRTALHAVADSSTSGVRCDVDIDLVQRPWLRWEWRVDRITADATVTDDDQDDCPARLVLGLSLRDRLFSDQVELFTGTLLPFATLCYVWDGQAPVGAVLPYARSGRIRYQVVESGSARLGQWQSYRRNLVEDFQRVYGEPPGRLVGVGVLTDSDDLKGRAEAWYGDLVVE
jgi:hypothetical protein